MPGLSQFRCAICWPAVLLHSAGVAPGPGDGDGGGGGGVPTGPSDNPGGSGDGVAPPAFASSDDFAERVPDLALETRPERTDWKGVVDNVIADLRLIHEGDGRAVVDVLLETREANSGEEPNVATLHSVGPGLLLADQVSAAEEEGRLDHDLFADALGVASWAIDVGVGRQPDAARLGLLADARIAFAIGVLSPAYA